MKLKKYFYVLRPILACRWILERNVPPPMAFSELAAAELPERLRSLVDGLLEMKIHQPEIACIPRVEALNVWLESEMARIQTQVEALPHESPSGWEELNALFLSELQQTEFSVIGQNERTW